MVEPGSRLGSYDILAPLGAGGMGAVYRARDTRLGRDVAIKVLPLEFANDPERIARFQREAQVLASLNHPHIAQIYGLEETANTHALVMELVDGETLDRRIARGAIPVDEALPIAKQIAEAFEAAHEKGIIHRDLKPSNIALTKDGQVKVLDFGLAKLVEAPGSGAHGTGALSLSPTITSPALMTGIGVLLGTAAYMSPEQAKGREADKRSDVWAFGCVLYEMLTGKRAFGGEDVGEVLASVIKGAPEWNALPDDVPTPVVTLMRACLDRPRDERPDASGVRFVLAHTRALAPPQARGGEATRRSARGMMRWLVAVAAAAAMVLLGVLAVPRWLRPTDAGAPYVLALTPPTGVRFSPPSANHTVHFDVSRDGTRVVFVGVSGTNPPRLFVRNLVSDTATELAGTNNPSLPFWSADGTKIGFFSQSKLRTVDPATGEIVTLTDARPLMGGSWNRDGTILFSSTPGRLMQIQATGGVPRPATTLSAARAETRHAYPHFLPDGQHFLYWSDSQQPKYRGLYVASLDGTESRLLMAGASRGFYFGGGYIAYLIDGRFMIAPFDTSRRAIVGAATLVSEKVSNSSLPGYVAAAGAGTGLLAYAAAAQPRKELQWMDRTGNVVDRLALNDASSPALAPDGRSVALIMKLGTTGDSDAWVLTGAGRPQRVSFNPGAEEMPVWSRDGQALAYSRKPAGQPEELLTKRVDGSGAEMRVATNATLPAGLHDARPYDWTPDGRALLVHALTPTTAWDIWSVPLQPGATATPIVQSPGDDVEPVLSPDGHWLAYTSFESGQAEVYVQAFPKPTARWQVSAGGGSQPIWRRDGGELFYRAEDSRLMAMSVKTTAAHFEYATPTPLFPTKTLESPPYPRTINATARGDRFLLVNVTDDGMPAAIAVRQMKPR